MIANVASGNTESFFVVVASLTINPTVSQGWYSSL